jgi:hypothetical protein
MLLRPQTEKYEKYENLLATVQKEASKTFATFFVLPVLRQKGVYAYFTFSIKIVGLYILKSFICVQTPIFRFNAKL